MDNFGDVIVQEWTEVASCFHENIKILEPLTEVMLAETSIHFLRNRTCYHQCQSYNIVKNSDESNMVTSQITFTSSKLTIETLEKGVKYV